MAKLEDILEELEKDYKHAREELFLAMTSLGDSLVRDAARFRRDKTSLPNSLGEIQSRGSNIDRLCAVVVERERALKLAKLIEK